MRLMIVAAVSLGCLSKSQAATPPTYTGKVLPFEIITAIRNYGFREGMRPAQVAVSVRGGSQADWLATAAFVAEKSIVPDVTYAEVEVYVASPWGDLPPTRSKQLAKAYYGGPDPTKSPWPDDSFSIYARNRSSSLPDIEFFELSNKLLEESPITNNPERDADAASMKAEMLIRKKYHLPKTWKHFDALLDPSSTQTEVERAQVIISDTSAADGSMVALRECLTRVDETSLFRGCPDKSERYSFHP